MANQIAKNNQVTVSSLISNDEIRTKFDDVLGKKSNGFIASLIAASKNDLKGVEPNSVLRSAMTAATLDLPIDKNLGFAYIVPYSNKKTGVKEAQFQLSYKGYVQLAIRSGQYKTINAIEIYEHEIARTNRLTGEVEFNENDSQINRNKVVGYMAYFKLINGFEKAIYMSKEEMEAHAKKYSQSYSSKKDYVVKGSLWTTDFDSMAKKTVLKQLISKYGIMSIEMQTAVLNDQAVIDENNNPKYVDNQVEQEIEENANKTTIDMSTVVDTEFKEVANTKTEDGPVMEVKEGEVPF
ncbi:MULTISPECIES: recombinase RecT [Clostridia]|uniref:recombinase RecT n=1 Tax=Clostridia TaxID=186801 RepID=UPI002A8E77F2|nr:recombinase RecT [Peptostreptococcus porci]MDY5098714.1 recombinase RecT [Clostridium sp.]MDY5437489.1 recombinase RecT [Peptostreptococcus porci]